MRFTMTLAVAAAALATALPAMAQSTAAPSDPAAQTEAAAATEAAPATSGTDASATAAATTPTLKVGQSVKDKTDVVIAQIAELKPGADGQQATVKMGEQSFVVGASSFVVQDGAAVINATQAELKSMIASATKPAG